VTKEVYTFLFEIYVKTCGVKVKTIFMMIYTNVTKKTPTKSQGAQSSWKVSVRKRMVEVTKGCDINHGKYAKHMHVHKIRITNFVDLHFKGIMNP
jgi:ribosomal protein L23